MNTNNEDWYGRSSKCQHCGAITTQYGPLPEQCSGECSLRYEEGSFKELDFSDSSMLDFSLLDEPEPEEEFIHSYFQVREEDYE